MMNIGENLQKMFSLEGSVVVFTGAAGGIGSTIAEGMALAGARVALCDINQEQLEQVQKRITEAGGEASCHRLDVTDKDCIEECIDGIGRQYKHIDILVNCAGIDLLINQKYNQGNQCTLQQVKWSDCKEYECG